MRHVDGHPSYKTRLFPHLVYNSNGYSTYVAVVKIETLRIHVKHIKNRLHARNMDDESGWKISRQSPASTPLSARYQQHHISPTVTTASQVIPINYHHRRPHYLKRFIRPLSFFSSNCTSAACRGDRATLSRI